MNEQTPKEKTALEKIYTELAEEFKNEPNKNKILGFTMGTLEKYKAEIVNETIDKFKKALKNL